MGELNFDTSGRSGDGRWKFLLWCTALRSSRISFWLLDELRKRALCNCLLVKKQCFSFRLNTRIQCSLYLTTTFAEWKFPVSNSSYHNATPLPHGVKLRSITHHVPIPLFIRIQLPCHFLSQLQFCKVPSFKLLDGPEARAQEPR